MNPKTQEVVETLLDYLIEHPFFSYTVKSYMGLSQDVDIATLRGDAQEAYFLNLENLVDQTLVAMVLLNKSGSTPS